jgi:hypothetical protein
MPAQASNKLQATESSPRESAVTPSEGKLSELETRKLWAWNRLLLPLMIGMVVGLTLFFFAASMFQLYALQESIADSPELDLKTQLAEMPLPGKASDIDAQQRWKTLSLLEEHAVRQRYHQANVLLMARVWVRYLGFVTGMIMSLVGAVFVLGKLREARTELSVGSQEHQGRISTHSPGLILASLGTLLMFTTLLTHHEINVNDGPLYVLLPYSKVTLSATRPSAPEDVTRLQASIPQQGAAAGAPKPASGSSAQQELDATADQIEQLLKSEGQGTQ